MAVDLFSLDVKLAATGTGAVLADLRAVDAQGVKTAANLNGLAGSLDRNASAALNGTKGFKDLSGAYANQERVLATLTPATATSSKAVEEHAEKTAKATKAAKEHGETLHGLWGTVKQLAGAYFLFEGVHFIGEALESAAALHELSQRTGASAESLSVLQFAGRRAEVSTEGLGNAFKFMAVSLGNLRDGVDKTEGAYAKLGFTSASFKGLSPEQTFLKLAIAVGSYKDVTERAEIAQRIFGRGANTMLPLFQDLAVNGWAKTTEEAKKFNAVVTQEMADAADKFHDDWGDIVDMLKGMARTTLPAVTLAVQSLYQVMMKGDGPAGFWASLWARIKVEAHATLGDLLRIVDVATFLYTFGQRGTHYAREFGKAGQHGADPGGFRGDNLGMGERATGALTDPLPEVPQLSKGAAELALKQKEDARKEYIKDVLGKANMDEAMRPADSLDLVGFGGSQSPHQKFGGVRTGPLKGIGGGLSPAGIPGMGGPDTEFMGGSLGGDLESLFAQGGDSRSVAGKQAILAAFANEAKRQAVALKVQFATLGQGLGMTLATSFSAAIGAAMSGKNVFKAFGNAVLAGLGSIFSQMGHSMMAAGLALIKLLPFLNNPLTGGPALLAAGIILSGVGAALGGIAHGSGGGSGGGGGGSDFRDRTTQITLTPTGAGGTAAPHAQVGPTIHVLGKDSPEGQRLFGEHAAAAKRSRNM